MLGVLTALAISLVVGPLVIRKLTQYQIGQSVRDDGPKTHLTKAGTPTMGGALILVVIVITTLLWGDLSNRYVWIVLLVTLAFGAHRLDRRLPQGGRTQYPRGCAARWKYFWQSMVGLGAGCSCT